MHNWMCGHGSMGWGWLMMVLGSLFWIILIALIIVVIIRLWQGNTKIQSATPKEDEALSILRQRNARGEINADEFERIRRDLKQ